MITTDLTPKVRLSWRCLDDFDSAGSDGMFYGKYDVPVGKTDMLRDVCSLMKSEWRKKLKSFIRGGNLRIAGGNYTFFFVLPYLLKRFIETRPLLSVNLTLLEARELKSLDEYDVDLVLTGQYEGRPFDRAFFSRTHVASRRKYSDEAYMVCSSELVSRTGSKECAASKFDLLRVRIYKTMMLEEQASYLFRTTPKGREGEVPRISVDLYGMGLQFLLSFAGIWNLFSREAKCPEISIIEDQPLVKMKRLMLYKKGLLSTYRKDAESVLGQLYRRRSHGNA